jgi:hypothetical protein
MKKMKTKTYALKKMLMAVGFLTGATAFAQDARVQIIHNSADAATQTVDIYAGTTLLVDDFEFRTATPFIDVAPGTVNIGIAPGTSISSADNLATFPLTLSAGETYVAIANGILSPSGYSPLTAVTLDVMVLGQESAATAGNTDVLVHHGSTDAPTVDVSTPGGTLTPLVDDASYRDFTAYLELPTADYTLNVTDETGANVVASFQAPLATLGLGDAAAVVVASGFFDPSVNSDGPAFGLWVALPEGGDLVELPASKARVQVIHNSADAAASEVDVYLDGALLIDDFAFRTASSFIDAPAVVDMQIDIAPSNSTSVANTIATFNYTLDANETYVLVAEGIISPSGYSPATTFDLAVYGMGQESAATAGNTDVLVHHGSTDAPAVDIYESSIPAGNIVTNASYSDFSNYINLGTADYRLEVRPTGDTDAVASYEAPLATLGLEDSAIVVVASGFLDPSVNSDGPAFGLWVALPEGGDLVELPASKARVQVIHNSADAAASEVDVYLDGELLIDDFAFRTASSFIDAPAGSPIEIDIAPSNSTSVANSIANFNYTLAGNETYILVAEGIISPSGYSPATTFDLAVYGMGREVAQTSTKTDVLVHHGATDAPTVDVYESSVPAGTLVDDASYGDFAPYLELATSDYILEVQDETGANVVSSYAAPLSTLGLEGAAITVVASGFLDPSENSDGPAFGLWVALAAGGDLVELPVGFVSIADENLESYKVFPNPAINEITITGSSVVTGNIVDQTGKVVLRFTTNTINISELSSGIYFINLEDNKGISTQKMIKY